jgi:D-2-hydroxyacid dehydrogenase (NADP+)
MHPLRAALVLPDVDVRRDFEKLLREQLDGLSLTVLGPVSSAASPEVLAPFEAVFTFGQFLGEQALAKASALRWIQCLGSGVDGLIDRSDLASSVWVTSARGVHDICVSETAFALMLSMARDVPRLVRQQAERRWEPWQASVLAGRTVGILGVGLIAEALAKRCKAFDMRVEGVSLRTSAPNFDRLRDYAQLSEAVADFDYFVVLAPLSAQTRGIVDAHVLAKMKPSAILINVSRGGIVDEAALIEALREKRLSAAALDVFDQEPLKVQSPLWSMDNVLVSPHAAGQHRDYARDVMAIVSANYNAMRMGRLSELVNVVRPGGGSQAVL